MKFSFINPSPTSGTPDMVVTAWPPLGMLYCAGVLENEGIEVSILDQAAKRFSTKHTLEWVRKEDPEILGFSVLNSSALEAVKLARYMKAENPNLTIVFGNYHATFNAERILDKYSFVDMVVRGEGEYTCLDLAKCLERNDDVKYVKGITFKKNGKVVSSPDRAPIKDLDALSFPNRNLIDAKYSSTIYGVKVATKKFTTIVSSRGCPFQCTFCGCRKFARGTWRARSTKNVMEEVQLLLSQGYSQFLFVDDNFTMNHRRVLDFCRSVKEEGIDIDWFCDSRVDNCNYNVLRQMVKAGCRIIYFGVESANQRILDYYKKGITPQEASIAVQKARRAGVDVIVGSFMLGAPDETRKEIQNTLRFAHRLDIDVPQLNVLGAFTGTDLWDELVARGFINEEQLWETGVYASKVSPYAVPFEELCSMIYEYFRSFYLRPKLLLTETLRTMRSSYRLAALLNNIAKLDTVMKTLKQGVRLS